MIGRCGHVLPPRCTIYCCNRCRAYWVGKDRAQANPELTKRMSAAGNASPNRAYRYYVVAERTAPMGRAVSSSRFL